MRLKGIPKSKANNSNGDNGDDDSNVDDKNADKIKMKIDGIPLSKTRRE